ncbi:uncharacterized protein J8A68_005803 [[Candida] subhashii]|uniref:Zn(2)-C6 fungal-type domain-containing protein n=1 Tax=[Candida] subhashii TaxID=561895 RepID=A0A8J5QGB3_9ASCO|nr:uncharacterized protein J8A68_005803 [[Candida] subhashii]KAG7660686.1 hypothetical protein J8A68_005803 [[Candida] subhashii]
MFVFPAFDSNYKTRKRTFKCCSNCRVKRTKCDITASDYELMGCLNCRKHKWSCSLVKGNPQESTVDEQVPRQIQPVQHQIQVQSPMPPPSSSSQQSPAQPLAGSSTLSMENIHTTIPNTPTAPSSFTSAMSGTPARRFSSASSIGSMPPYQPMDMTRITPQFLHDSFNFNISSHSDSTFQYLIHGHPKVVMSSTETKDKTIWHESGVYVNTGKDGDESDTNNKSKKYKVKHFGNDLEKQFYLKSERIYQFLLSINAFTLSSPEYPLTKEHEFNLLNLYFYKINSIFPIVSDHSFWEEYNNNKAQNIMIYSMILVIAKDKLAEPILKPVFLNGSRARTGEQIYDMTQEQYNIELVKFLTDLEYKIRQILLILPQLGDEDKFSRIVIHLLLSLHFGYDRLGNEQSAHDLMDSIGIATAMGIHMKRLQQSAEFIEYSTNLWWCCYIFDRFNGLVNSRPCFIKSEDFNVDLPYKNITLLKMVQIARNLESMFFAVFRPFNNNNIPSNDSMGRYSKFNLDEFQRIEFELCEQERTSFSHHQQLFKIGKTTDSLPDYITDATHFISRMVNNVVILASQKAKYDNPDIPNHIPEALALRASSNMLWYLSQMDDRYVTNIPMIPWCMSLSMAVALKKKARTHLTKYNFPEYEQYKDVFEFEDYLVELEKFAPTYWVVDEICRLTRDFVNKLLNKKKSGSGSRKRRTSAKNNEKSAGSVRKMIRSDSSSGVVVNTPNNNVVRSEGSPVMAVPPPTGVPIPVTTTTNNIDNSPLVPPGTSEDISGSVTTNSVAGSVTSDMFDQYDQYFESMQIDIFNNDFFTDVPNVINLLN